MSKCHLQRAHFGQVACEWIHTCPPLYVERLCVHISRMQLALELIAKCVLPVSGWINRIFFLPCSPCTCSQFSHGIWQKLEEWTLPLAFGECWDLLERCQGLFEDAGEEKPHRAKVLPFFIHPSQLLWSPPPSVCARRSILQRLPSLL